MGDTRPTEPPYALGTANEPILLYVGDARLTSSYDDSVSALTRVEFRWLPSPRVTFTVEDAIRHWWHRPDPTYELTLLEAPGSPSAPASVRLIRTGATALTAGGLSHIDWGAGFLDRITFVVPNWRSMLGARLDDNGTSWMGRVSFTDHEWRVRLDARRDLGTIEDELRLNGGYAITYVGELSRSDGAAFDVQAGRDCLEALRYFFGFVRGLWTPPTLAVGLLGDDVVWREWSSVIGSPWRANRSWDADPSSIGDAFEGFMDRWCDPRWQESIKLAVSWLVEANASDPAERSIVLAQVALELLGWLILVEDERYFSRSAWKDTSAEEHTRSLLERLQIPLGIPEKLTSLIGVASCENWGDGPQALTGFRNKLVHPRDRAEQILATPTTARVQLAELASSYCELALLYFFHHAGTYLNRHSLQTEPVPWAEPDYEEPDPRGPR